MSKPMREQAFGYVGKILRIDLSGGAVSFEPTMDYAREWLGGAGIGQWMLYSEVKSRMTPYAPANRLIFGAGPLVGTLAPGSSRISADSLNAFTNGVGTSNCDSHFGHQLKFAGFDQIVFQGKARKPVYLWIDDGRAEIRDAAHLWGKTTWETVDALRRELQDRDLHILSIGPAGENIVRGACIIQDKGRAFGRCGLGGVMGSKNLKAIAVRGTGGVRVSDPKRFLEAVDHILDRFSRSSIAAFRTKYGTPGSVIRKQQVGGISYRNFQDILLPDEDYQRLHPDNVQPKYMMRNIGYMSCPTPCSRSYRIDDGPYAGFRAEGYQFEALADFGGKMAASNPAFIIKLNAYCNQMGMDIDAVAGPIAWAMECYQRGLLSAKEADGLAPRWGDEAVILELARKIVFREGFGDILGEGCAYAADWLGRGSDYYAMHVKGQDLYEVIRGAVGWGLGTCVSTRGGGHTTGAPSIETGRIVDPDLAEKVFGVRTIMDPLTYEGKVKLVGYYERLHRINNAFGICHFATTSAEPAFSGFPDMAELYSAATGIETSEHDLRNAGARILNVEKAFNLLHTDLGRKDDYPPRRDMEEPIPSGPTKGWKFNREDWDRLLDEYYEMNHWDKKTGFPTREGLEELGLKTVADDLERAGKLGRM